MLGCSHMNDCAHTLWQRAHRALRDSESNNKSPCCGGTEDHKGSLLSNRIKDMMVIWCYRSTMVRITKYLLDSIYEESLQSKVHYEATRACDRPQCAGTWKCARMCAHVSCGLASTLRRARAHMTSTISCCWSEFRRLGRR